MDLLIHSHHGIAFVEVLMKMVSRDRRRIAGLASWTSVVCLAVVVAACSDSSSDLPAGSAGSASNIPAASARRSVPLLGPVPTHDSAADAPNARNVTAQFREERHQLEAQIEADPADTVALLKLAHLLHDAHLEAEAEPHYAAYTRRHPANRQAWLDLATVQAAAVDWASARASTEAMLRLYPGDPAGLYNLGAIFANTGEMERAAQTWQRVADQRDNPELAAKAVSSLQRLKSFQR